MKKKEINLLMRLMSRDDAPVFSGETKTLNKLLNMEIPGLAIKSINIRTVDFREPDHEPISAVTMEYIINPGVWYEWISKK